MTITGLITNLQEVLEKEGDLPVLVEVSERHGWPYLMPAREVEEFDHEEHGKCVAVVS